MPTSATRDGSSAGRASPSWANHSGARPSAAASGIPWTLPDGLVSGVLRSPWASIQITPPGCPAAAARPGERADRDRVVAAEHERPGALAHGLLDERRELGAGLEDLGQVPRPLVGERERLGLGRDDVAAVGDGERRSPASRSSRPAYRIADGPMSTPRRVWPRSSGRADDRDGTLHGAEPYLG